ncbi:MAG: DUF2157 domain-containing protein [Legionellales bacterium]|nr:DUF2157 domain-containing protein [Legionellales bacterium]
MKISKAILDKAVLQNVLKSQDAHALYEFLQNEQGQESGFDLTQVLYYFGAFLALSAMSIFMNKGWQAFGGWGIFALSLVYMVLGLWLSKTFQKRSFIPPSGLCALFVVCLTALSIYAFQLGMGWWPEGGIYRDYHSGPKWNCFFMELGTLIVGFIMAYRYRYAFMIIPLIVTAWYLSIDITAMTAGTSPDFTLTASVSLFFGLISLLIAFWINRRQPHTLDYAFWIYLLGSLSFWGGLTCQESHHEFSKFLYLCINLLLMGVGVILLRKIFVFLGALGCCLYIGHLTAQIFQNSGLFPLSLTVIGFMVVYLGTLWQKNAATITHRAQSMLPKAMQDFLPTRQRISE